MKKLRARFGLAVALCLACAPFMGAQTLPAGTEVQVRLAQQLETSTARAGQSFTGTLAQPVMAGGRTVLAKGATVQGRVMEAVSSGRLKRPASITLQLRSLNTDPLRIDGKSHLLRNVGMIGGGSAAGAIIGALADGKQGAAIGAAVGAGAGTATAFMTGKKEIVLPAETLLTFVVGGGGQTAARSAPLSRSPRQAQSSAPAYPGREPEVRAAPQYAAVPQYGATPMFSERDQQLIRRYYQMNTANLPPGLAKRGGNLPPGLERQLERNGTLPPGLQKRVQPFPEELSRQLPPLPSGYSRVIIGVRALILDRGNRILDLMFTR